MHLAKFLAFNALGAALWVGAWSSVGYPHPIPARAISVASESPWPPDADAPQTHTPAQTHTPTARRFRPRGDRRWSFAQGLMAILLIAAAVRLLVTVLSPHYLPTNDAADYDRHAVAIATTGSYPLSGLGGPTAFRLPAFPVLLAGVDKLVGVGAPSTRWEAGRIAEALLGVIAVGLIGLIARSLWGSKAALLSAALAAVYPPLLLVGSSLLSEPLYIALTLGAVLAALAHRRSAHPLGHAVLAGVLTGLAALTRGNGIFVLLPVALLV